MREAPNCTARAMAHDVFLGASGRINFYTSRDLSSSVKTVTFDLYGTLVDWQTSISKALEYIRPGISGRFFEVEFSLVKGLARYVPYSDVLSEALRRTLAEEGVSLEEEHRRLLVTSFAKSPPFPDSLLGLMLLRKRGFRTGIISNTERGLARVTLAGIEDLFDYVVTAEDTGFYKPDRRAFTEAYRMMGLDISEAIHVSAYPQYDLETADSLGIETICLDRYGYSWRKKIPTLDRIIELI